MNKSVIAIFAFAALTITSCMKTPVACFTPSKTTAVVNESITFDGTCTTDAHHYEWTFGDGANATSTSPTHAYTAAGTYTVKLTGLNKNMKKMNEVSKTITIQ